MINQDSSTPPPVRIVIVGAGVSGMTCARRLTQLLKKRPHKITVLEARDRIGGRTYSIPELNLDLGASWIFSPHTAVRSLARELNIELLDQYEDGYSLMGGGNGDVRRTVMHGIHGGASRLRGGTGSLCTAILTELTSRHRATVSVQLNSPVVSIDHHEDKTVAITLGDSSSIVTDYVILALPPKLITSTIRLTPALPSSLTRQLSECNTWMSSTCKAILVYERAWWQEQRLSGFAMSRQSKAQEWHDASSDTCNALFVFCVAGTTKQQAIDGTVAMFGNDAKNPTAVHLLDWSKEAFTTTTVTEGRGSHPHTSNDSRRPQWNGHLWFGNSEVSDMDGGFVEGAVVRGMQVADQLSALL